MRLSLSVAIFFGLLSTQTTSLPLSARQVPVTSPTYPVPITATFTVQPLLGRGRLGGSGCARRMARPNGASGNSQGVSTPGRQSPINYLGPEGATRELGGG